MNSNDIKMDPFEYWRLKQNILSEIALRILSTPCSESEVERLFKGLSFMLILQSNWSKDDLIDAKIVVKCRLRCGQAYTTGLRKGSTRAIPGVHTQDPLPEGPCSQKVDDTWSPNSKLYDLSVHEKWDAREFLSNIWMEILIDFQFSIKTFFFFFILLSSGVRMIDGHIIIIIIIIKSCLFTFTIIFFLDYFIVSETSLRRRLVISR